jgi:hypothetical protein
MKFTKSVLITLALIASIADAKSFGGSSSSSSRSSSSSWSSKSSSSSSSSKPSSSWFSKPASSNFAPKAAVVATPTVANNFQASNKPSGFAPRATVAASATPVATPAVQAKTSAVDAQLAKNTATTGRTMQTKAQADDAYRQSLVAKTQYTSAAPPTTKPDYVPNDVQVSGHPVHVTYNHYSSGGYGYGYYDPTSHLLHLPQHK